MYMPAKLAEQVLWSANFSQQIGEPGFNVGLSEAQITAFNAVNGTLQAAWMVASDPTTRTRITVANMHTALKNMRVMAKNLVSIIQGTSTVTDGQKEALRITVRKTHPTPVPVPTTEPKIEVVKVNGHEVTLRLSDADRPTSKARPVGTMGFTLMTYVGETPSMDTQAWTLQGNRGKPTKFVVDFDQSLEPGTTVWFTAFWYNARGESGPATEPVSATIQFGGMSKGTIQSSEPKARQAA